MRLPDQLQKRVDALKAAMPTSPIRDGVVSHAGSERAEIAEIYLRAGDEDAAVEWFLEATRFSRASGDVIGATVLVKRLLRIRAHHEEALRLYAELWKLLGLGDAPDPVA